MFLPEPQVREPSWYSILYQDMLPCIILYYKHTISIEGDRDMFRLLTLSFPLVGPGRTGALPRLCGALLL